MDETSAYQQDIRPLRIAILNLMPTKETTETQLLRLVGNTPIQVDIVLVHPKSHTSKNTSQEYLDLFYKTFDEIEHRRFDGMIITGAPVEQMDFEDVNYWKEIQEIFEWTKTNVTSTMHICWASQAGLYHHFGVPKIPLDEKCFGVFSHTINRSNVPLLRGFDEVFNVPHSRHTEVRREDIEKNEHLEILAESEEAGIFLVATKDGKQIFATGHADATKYLGGHNDVLAGLIITKGEELSAEMAFLHNSIGAVLSPSDSYQLMKGMKTLALRMERHEYNALTIAKYLLEHPAVNETHADIPIEIRDAVGVDDRLLRFSVGIEHAEDLIADLGNALTAAQQEIEGGVHHDVPIYQASTFHHFDIFNPPQHDYSRSGNPTRQALEDYITLLEGGARGFAYSSGMAAISSVFMMFSAGDHMIVTEDVYGGTYRLLTSILSRMQIETTFVDMTNIEEVKAALKPNTKAVYMETPSNPTLRITDIAAVTSWAQEHELISILDNTFMTPYYQRPIELGVDIVVHSATKFLGGHSDVLAGLAVARTDSLGRQLKQLQNGLGTVLGAQESWLLMRGMKTLGARMAHSEQSTAKLAAWLSGRSDITAVFYPGLLDHPGREAHERQSSGPGSEEGYVLPDEVIFQKIKETEDVNGTEILMQGGTNPNLPFSYYTDLLKAIKERFPNITMHSFSPAEIMKMVEVSDGLTLEEVVRAIHEAGLDSLPGGGAEILDDRTRRKISRLKGSWRDWMDVMQTAHRIGMNTTATMVIGLGETMEERALHLLRVREAQDECIANKYDSEGFLAFIPWTFQPDNTNLKLERQTPEEYLKTVAISRLVLDNIKNIQSSWVTMGPEVGKKSLEFGCNDFGSTMIEENVVSAAGATYKVNISSITQLIRESGYIPAQRNTRYDILRTFDEENAIHEDFVMQN
ncbi:hypothetical protein G195_000883 [Phytophthora kernoviae 00238/432]|uniref:cysteine-S-conjugate beta-lyase n=1 Tax=Phytophthora kernoviae 00238/432 TaxID=1284355 RepID=A0A8J4SGJ6_9STRA|nr:hypothetical protein G195_000883 [Phytophthora kernoviae 00238/432]